MKFFTAVSTLILAATAALAAPSTSTTVTVSYDQTYDNGANSLDIVACSNGPNGMEHLGKPKLTPISSQTVFQDANYTLFIGYTTFGSLPTKYIGGAAAIAGWGSAECGTCWQLSYNGNTVNVLAIDHAGAGFNIALSAMNALTDDQGVFLGRVNAQATQVDKSLCGLH